MGFVGLPNVGKSSLTNLLSGNNVCESANYPFCTIDPNVVQCIVPSKDFKYLAECYKPPSVVPAVLKVTDIAGLIKGASEGAGLGNAFLSHIAAVDGIYHLVRAFEDDEVIHVDDSIDPIRDLETIQGELCLKDKSTLEIVLEREHERVRKEKNLSRSATNYTLSEVFTSAFDKVCSCGYNYKQEVGKKMSFCIKLLLNLTNAVPYNICVYIYIGNEIG